MPRQMPRLEHKGEKFVSGKAFMSIPMDIWEYANKELTYTENKVLMYLIGNKPKDGNFEGWQISNISDATGISDTHIRTARRTLESLGFIQQVETKNSQGNYETIIVDFDKIRDAIARNLTKQDLLKK